MRDHSTPAAVARLALAATVLGLAVAARRPARVPVLTLPSPLPAPVAAPAGVAALSPALAATLTADDVARGVGALARGEGPGLSPEERARLLPFAEEGQRARREVDALQARRRQAREALRGSGLELVAALGAMGGTAAASGGTQGAP